MDENPTSTLPKTSGSGSESSATPWYQGVTPYQWLILTIASAGWVFDVYEGQIFNLTRNQLLTETPLQEAHNMLRVGAIVLPGPTTVQGRGHCDYFESGVASECREAAPDVGIAAVSAHQLPN